MLEESQKMIADSSQRLGKTAQELRELVVSLESPRGYVGYALTEGPSTHGSAQNTRLL